MLVFTICVLVYSITMEGSSIYELVSGAYQVPLVGAFVPLLMGVYWKRATTQGALVKTLGVSVAPTVMFFGRGGREVAERLSGTYISDFYGAYLEQRLEQARAAVRS